MKIFLQISIASIILLSGCAPRQTQSLSKAEASEWKALANEYKKNPAALKVLTEERDRYREEVETADQRIQTVQNELMQERQRNAELQQQLTQVRNELMVTRQTNEGLMQQIQEMEQVQIEPTAPPEQQQDYTRGTVFRIQVGAFKEVPARFNQYPDLYIDEDGGLKKAMLGSYRDYEQAKVRLSQLKREGFSSAWIVGYVNGRRVSLREALSN